MDADLRMALYTMQNGVLPRLPFPGDEDSPAYRITAAQARRRWHKEMRAQNDYEPVDTGIPVAERPKGRPTTRRADATRQKRARRRAKELIRTRQ